LPVGGAAPRTFAPAGKNPRAATVYKVHHAPCSGQNFDTNSYSRYLFVYGPFLSFCALCNRL